MWDAFWNRVCDFQHVLHVLIILNLILIVLSTLSLPFVEWGTGASVIAVVNFGILLSSLTAMTFFFKKCDEYNTI